jgi:hypothetical protein
MAVSVPTHPKTIKGRRYRVVIEGRCDYQLGGDVISIGNIEINADDPQVVSVEVLPDPLKVGTEIRGESPIPVPIGTVLRGANGVIMEKTQYGWLSPGSEHAVVKNPNPTGPPDIFPLTVLYVPEETS